ncbi:hypothetical protein DOTSEDRAFT_69713 [Dothistroma septosporum NZE10]|uniref:Uncharacterized protein n=1 Tax=Dothistroma septosporum (strain NZE10 / CBS 128990) TaxID=675120 RepID=N1PZQ7_DOTSN|nr:hypothetical protein DOTSEDRAFT_69713 [Dothistroma septosporum NZE10]
MDTNVIDSERRIAYGVLAMLVAIWSIGVLVVKFCGGGDEPETERGVGIAFKDLSSSKATTQASSQVMMRTQAQGVETGDTEKAKGPAEH